MFDTFSKIAASCFFTKHQQDKKWIAVCWWQKEWRGRVCWLDCYFDSSFTCAGNTATIISNICLLAGLLLRQQQLKWFTCAGNTAPIISSNTAPSIAGNTAPTIAGKTAPSISNICLSTILLWVNFKTCNSFLATDLCQYVGNLGLISDELRVKRRLGL